MKISVIIPYKNTLKYIKRCIDSCMNAPGDFEFIFIDDNDKENTRETLMIRKASLKDDRIFFMPNELEHGVSGARNTGLEYAEGDWITFLDADDELLPNAYEQMMAAIEHAQGHPIVQLNHQRYYEKIDKTACKYANEAGVYTLKNMPQCWCMVWNKLIKHEFIEKHTIRFVEGLQYGEDEIFNIRMMAYHPAIIHADKDCIAIRRHFDNKKSLSRSKNADSLYDQIDALEDELDFYYNDQTELKCFICDLIAEHWQSPTYKHILGGRDE